MIIISARPKASLTLTTGNGSTSTAIKAFDSVTLACTFDEEKQLNFKFYKDSHLKQDWSSDNSFQIPSFIKDHVGRYKCMARQSNQQNNHSAFSEELHLSVGKLPSRL